MSYTSKLTETQHDNLDVRIYDIASSFGKRDSDTFVWTIDNHQIFTMARALLDSEEARIVKANMETTAPERISLTRDLVARLTKWRLCMSYNDSYFGEPAGEVKRIALEMERAVTHAPAQPTEAEWITKLRKELMLSKITHNFTFTRDEVIELLGGKFYLLTGFAPVQSVEQVAVAALQRDYDALKRLCRMAETEAAAAQVELKRMKDAQQEVDAIYQIRASRFVIDWTDVSERDHRFEGYAEDEKRIVYTAPQTFVTDEIFDRQKAGFERCFEALGISDDRERSWSSLVMAINDVVTKPTRTERDAFELWARDQGLGKTIRGFDRNGHWYHDDQLDAGWRVWQARAGLERHTKSLTAQPIGAIIPVVGSGTLNLDGTPGVTLMMEDYLQSLWQTGVPPTKENDYDQYIVAVRRARYPEAVFVFTSYYANQYADDMRDTDGNEFIANGWYDVGNDPSGEFSNLFTPILENDDEVLAWQNLPKYGA